jgi:hypothetical protein
VPVAIFKSPYSVCTFLEIQNPAAHVTVFLNYTNFHCVSYAIIIAFANLLFLVSCHFRVKRFELKAYLDRIKDDI